MNVEEVSSVVVDTAFHLHRDLGPGLLESVYEAVLARMLEERGLRVERQVSVAFDFNGMHFDEGLRVDLLVDGCLVDRVEIRGEACSRPCQAVADLLAPPEPACRIAYQLRCSDLQGRHQTGSEQTSGLRVFA